MTTITAKIYKLPEAEIHMVGKYTGVRWNCRINKTVKEIKVDGIIYKANVDEFERYGDPFIDFVDIRQDSQTNEDYIDDDSPVSGGMSADFAEKIAKELLLAVEYLRAQ